MSSGAEDIQDLYSTTLRDLARNPAHRGKLDNAAATARGDNPMCGDRVDIFLNFDGPRIGETRFVARGCEICQASAAMLAEMVPGKSPDEARALGEGVKTMARTGQTNDSTGEMARLSIFAVVHKFPSRVKCATLAWSALDAALSGVRETSSE
ncbi:MAG: nifU [Rubritepida sp.]|nr:nifU [Rubritepida sp.]